MANPRFSAAAGHLPASRSHTHAESPRVPHLIMESGSAAEQLDSHEAVSESYLRQIDSARQRGDSEEEARIRKEFEGFLSAFRAVEQLKQLVPVRSILAGDPLPGAADLEEVSELLKTLSDWRPDSAEGHLVRGCAYLITDEPTEALIIFNRMLSEGEGGVYLHCARGQALLALGRTAQAEESFNHGFELNEDDALSLIGRGRACMEQNRPDEALVAFRRALHLERYRAEIWFMCGDALLATNRPDEALLFLRRGLALAPDNEDANISVARALSKLGRGREALDAYEKIVSRRDDGVGPLLGSSFDESPGSHPSVDANRVVIRRSRIERPMRLKTRYLVLAAFGIALIGYLLGKG